MTLRCRIIVPLEGRVYVEGRAWFPWPHWRRVVERYFTPFDFECRPIDFASVEEAREWIGRAA